MITKTRPLLSPLLLALAFTAPAQSPPDAPPPAGDWERLSPAQRELLLQPLRERWNHADARQRQRMLAHAQRWRDMPPEERARARRGHDHFDRLTPEQQKQMRVLYEKTRDMPRAARRQTLVLFHAMRTMNAEQREALRREWAAMSPEQRQSWVREHVPHRGHAERRPDAPPRQP